MSIPNLKRPDEVECNRWELRNAVMKWRVHASRQFLITKDMYDFAEFIGYPHKEGADLIVDTKNPDVKAIIDLINGPNGNTILKILDIRHKDRLQCQK
jgi:hypothetical protein